MSEDPARVNCREYQFTHGYMPLHDGATCGPTAEETECACGCSAYDEFCELAGGPHWIVKKAKPETDRSDRETEVLAVLAVVGTFILLAVGLWLIFSAITTALGIAYTR